MLLYWTTYSILKFQIFLMKQIFVTYFVEKKKNKRTYSLILWVIDFTLFWEKNIMQEMHMYVYVLSCIQRFATSRTVAHRAGSFVHGIFQARILEWVAIFYSRQEHF